MNPTLVLILAAVGILAVMALVIRLSWRLFRYLSSRRNATGHESRPVTASPAVASERAAAANSDHVRTRSDVAGRPVDGPHTHAPSDSKQTMAATPATRRVFAGVGRPANDGGLRPVDPGEIPGIDESDRVFGKLTPTLAGMIPETDERRKTQRTQLRKAGFYAPHAPENFAAVRYLGLILPILFFGVLLVLVPPALEPLMIAGLVAGPILGWAIPSLYLNSRAAKRVREIEHGMPDLMDLLNMCVSQGMTVQAALVRIAHDLRHVYPALAQELRIVTEQARLGSLEQAMINFSRRIDVPEVHSFTTLVIQTERMGTDVSNALIDHSDNMRESMKQRADQQANSATFKLLFPTVLCLMPAVYLFLLGPAVIELTDFFGSDQAEILNIDTDLSQLTGQ